MSINPAGPFKGKKHQRSHVIWYLLRESERKCFVFPQNLHHWLKSSVLFELWRDRYDRSVVRTCAKATAYLFWQDRPKERLNALFKCRWRFMKLHSTVHIKRGDVWRIKKRRVHCPISQLYTPGLSLHEVGVAASYKNVLLPLSNDVFKHERCSP